MKFFKPSNAGYFELSAIAITAFTKFVVMDWLGMRAFYITGTCFFWAWYVYYRYTHDQSILKYWGLRRSNFWKSWKILLPFVVISTGLTAAYAINNDIALANWHIIPVIILYPLWGLIQQFIFLGIIALNLQHFRIFSRDRLLLFLAVSLVFSLIHYPYYLLMVFTLIMEIVFLYVYWKWRNLWAIGLAHGWTATFLLYYVLNRDLWKELFNWF